MTSTPRRSTLLFAFILLAIAVAPVRGFRKINKSNILPKSGTTRTRSLVVVDNNPASNLVNALPRGGGDNADYVDDAYGWVCNLGGPAALVAGAVIATLYETMANGSLDVERTDKAWVRFAKKATRLLLLTSFIFQVICIFCTTILGTLLLSRPAVNNPASSALEYLKENFEFEYLTSRICFLQGLLNWLGAIGIEHAIPQGEHETEARRNMDILIASSLLTLIIYMISFYNGHMTFYKNYFDMLCNYFKMAAVRFFWRWPPRIMTVLAIPPLLTALVYSQKVFFDFGEGTVNNKKVKK